MQSSKSLLKKIFPSKSIECLSRALCQKFPRKHTVLMTFLANMLREEGGYEYKRAIVNTIISIVEENPEAKEAGKNFVIYLFIYLSKFY